VCGSTTREPLRTLAGPPTQQLDYAEKLTDSYAPDPKAPFGFVPGANLTRARVVHWYLWQPDPAKPPQLRRSFPALTPTAMNVNCANTDKPFLDETNDNSGNVPTGTDMSGGAIESLQIRFMVDASGNDDPAQFTQLNSIGVCDTAVPATIREVRLQVVSRTASPDKDQADNKRVLYSTPDFEGATPSGLLRVGKDGGAGEGRSPGGDGADSRGQRIRLLHLCQGRRRRAAAGREQPQGRQQSPHLRWGVLPGAVASARTRGRCRPS
jgi:hypothetical protein